MQTDINISQYKKLDGLLEAIQENIKSLSMMHKSLLDESNKKILPYEYTVYIDDLYFQRNLLCKELDHLMIVKQMSIRRFYANLFRLYQHIIGKYVAMLKNRRIGVFGTPEHMRIFYEEPRIRIYNEIDVISVYRYNDIENITIFIRYYVDMIKKQLLLMISEIGDLQRKRDKGFHLISVLWAYQNEKSKLECDIMAFQQIFEAILVANEYLVHRFIARATELKSEITDTHTKSAYTLDTATSGSQNSSIYMTDIYPPQLALESSQSAFKSPHPNTNSHMQNKENNGSTQSTYGNTVTVNAVTVETEAGDMSRRGNNDDVISESRDADQDQKSVVDAMNRLIEENTNRRYSHSTDSESHISLSIGPVSSPSTPTLESNDAYRDVDRISFKEFNLSDSSDSSDTESE